MRDVVWIASYPRSGNTWLRFLIDSYFFEPSSEWTDVSRVVHELDYFVGKLRELGTDEQWAIEQVRGHLAAHPRRTGLPSDYFFKTHFRLTDDHLMAGRTRCAVHLLRNPRDVLLSGLNFAALSGRKVAETPEHYANDFISRGGDPNWIARGYGTWAEHADSWSQAARFPVLTVKYEDLRAEPADTLEAILHFVGAAIDRGRIDRAVEAASIDRLRSIEVKARGERVVPWSDKEGVFFFNKGLTGQKLAACGATADARFDAALGPDMRRYGYL